MTRYWKTSQRLWKVLDENGKSCHGGCYRWSLPTWDERKGWIPGEWTPLIKNVSPCERGYHVCRDKDLLNWLHARIYACEIRGAVIECEDKVVAGQVRLTSPTPWDDVSAQLFAVECASDVLSLYERDYPNDSRVSDCLQVAFRFALGDASESERDAARDAARAAAWDGARAAARDAASTAARAAARDAARAVAWDAASAARDAAWGAARDATWDAARAAQTKRLLWWMGAA